MPAHEHIQNGANIAYSIPIAFGVMLALKALEQTVIVVGTAGSKIHDRLRYGPDTDPHTWPSWEAAGIVNPNIAIRQRELEKYLNPTPEMRREMDEMRVLSDAVREALDDSSAWH